MSNYTSKESIEGLLRHMGVKRGANEWAEEWSPYFKKYHIDTPERISSFIATVLHESSGLKRLEENLNYSARALARTWPSRYAHRGKPNSLARKIARKPVAIANHTYSNRMGNGSVASGDGWKYRGRGPIQITGESAYRQIEEETGLPCVRHPEILSTIEGGAASSVIYWYKNGLNKYADRRDIDGVRDKVNRGHKTRRIGDSLGYKSVLRYYRKAMKWY